MANEPEKDNLEDILNALRHEEVTVREQAIQRLGVYVNSAGSDTHYDTLTGAEAIDAWDRARTRRLQQRGIVETLLLTIDDPSARIRQKTAFLLGHVAAPEAQEALVRRLRNDPVYRVRLVCTWALQSTPASPPVVDALIAALQDSDANVIASACKALGEREDTRAVEPLRAVLVHPSSWNVRFSACQALVHLHAVDRSVVYLLEELNQQPEAQEHNQLIISLNEVTAQHWPESARAQTTQEVLDQAHRALQ